MDTIRRPRRRRKRKHYFFPTVLFLASLVCIGAYLALDLGLPVGWVEQDGQTYYRSENRTFLTGWQEIEGHRYYFDDTGARQTGWLESGGKTYHLGEDGVMSTGWIELEGKRYYLGSDGSIISGWMTLENNRYYFLADGSAHTGWLELAQSITYMLPDGRMATGWQEIEGRRYYFSNGGTPATGWMDLDGKRYYFRDDHSAARGWYNVDGLPYYFGTDCALSEGLTETKLGLYFFASDGTYCTGWMTLEGYEYYFQEDGSAAVGKHEIGGKTYYFSPHGVNIVLVNPWNTVPDGYTVDPVAVSDIHIVDRSCQESLVRMLSDCKAAGLSPAICSAYRTQGEQEVLFARKVAFYTNQDYALEEAQKLAGTEVAVPGTSEHQLGLAVDIVDTNNWHLDETQASMPAQLWLMEHCWEYGFILRYPNGSSEITGIIYEPWHYRYVGVDIALEIRDLNITLEEYLGAVK